jgi:hypothetical protein
VGPAAAATPLAGAPAEHPPAGIILKKSVTVMDGGLRASGATHKNNAYTTPTANCAVAIVMAKSDPPDALAAFLFWML